MAHEEYWKKIEQAEKEIPEEEEISLQEQVSETRLQLLKKRIESHDLPIRSRLEEVEARVEAALSRSGMFLLLGETGSGKSIYSPLAVRNVLRKLGLPDRIIVLQPRKDAAKGVAEAHAAVTDNELGKEVGYSTSETKMVERDTPVRIVTSGILPRYLFNETVNKENTGAIILDEVHEGSLDYHYVFGLLKELRERGDAPFIFLTSATVKKEKFQKFFDFDDKDFMQIEGRTYPVEKKYLPSQSKEGGNLYEDPKKYLKDTLELVKNAIESERAGDILVFLPGAPEINEVMETLNENENEDVEVLPLHGGLSFEQRNLALSGERARGASRRIILATNIAETSVTVPNVTIVVDSCRRRSKKYDAKSGVFRTGTELISQEEAEQRAGRAGRVESGECYRVLREDTFKNLPEHTETEIERTSLAHLILRLRGYGRDPETFPFFVEPKKEALHAGVEQLKILGALDQSGNITEIGKRMLDMPFRPEDSRMMVEAEDRGCVDAALTLALFAREQKLFTFPTKEELDRVGGDKIAARRAIAREQEQFEQDNSDWAKRLNIFIQAIDAGVFNCLGDDRRPDVKHAMREFKGWCRMYHLNPEALKHVAYRLYEFSREAGISFDRYDFQQALRHTNPADLNKSILAGYQERLLFTQETGRMPSYMYLQKENSEEIILSPASSAFSSKLEFCIAGDIGEGSGTSWGREVKRNYASLIHPATFEDVLELMRGRLTAEIKGTMFDYKSGSAVEMVDYSLPNAGGMVLGSERRPIGGLEGARLLAETIVNKYEDVLYHRGESLPFHEENLRRLEKLKELSIRSRGKVPIPDLISWYRERLGNISSLDEARRLGDFLLVDFDKFCSTSLLENINQNYPEFLEVGGLRKKINYSFGEGDARYGIPSHFRASFRIEPEELERIPADDTFVVGPEGDEVPLRLEMEMKIKKQNFPNGKTEIYTGYSVRELKAQLGNPNVSSQVLFEYVQTKNRVQEMIEDMQYKMHQCESLGFQKEEFKLLIENLKWCVNLLEEYASNEQETKENIKIAGETLRGITLQLKNKQEQFLKQQERHRQEVYALYLREGPFIRTKMETKLASDYSALFEFRRKIEQIEAILSGSRGNYFGGSGIFTVNEAEKAFNDFREQVGADDMSGSLREAFNRAKGEKQENEKEISEKKTQKPVRIKQEGIKITQETVFTPAIREEMRGEVGYLETMLEDMLAKAAAIDAENTSKLKSKSVEAAERVLKRKELRKDLKELLKEIESDEKPTVVRGHIGKVRDSINSLLKANMHQMVVGYEKDGTETFRDLWDEVPAAIASDETVKEYIDAGIVTPEKFSQDVRELLKSYLSQFQKGEGDVSLQTLIMSALEKY